MKLNHWTLALAAAGVVSMGAVAQAEEATESVKTLVSGTTISGYVSTSAYWRPGTGTAYPAAISAFHGGTTAGANKHDGFNLDVVDITISKAMDEAEWASGYKAELWFGDDAFAYGTGGRGGAEDMAIKQAYVSLRAPLGNGIDFKMGVFDTIIGHEVANASENPNYTRSYAWALQPTTHTGLLASYRFSDLVAVSAGVANTRGPAINGRLGGTFFTTEGAESQKSYMAGFELTAPDSWGFLSGSKLHAQVIDSPNDGIAAATNSKDTLDVHVGAVLNTPVEAWKVGISYYYRANAQTASALATAHAADYASIWGLYNSYQVTEKLKVNLRAEYGSGSSGTFWPSAATIASDDDAGQEIFGLTGTIDYSLWENVISRLEARWDTAISGGGTGGLDNTPFGGTGTLVGGSGADEKNSFIVALNVIYKF